jgi:hypothetical protein
MKFCPVVPEICCGHVHMPKKGRRRLIIIIIISIYIYKVTIRGAILHFQNFQDVCHFENGRHNTTKIQHCPISSKFDMWVHNDVPN